MPETTPSKWKSWVCMVSSCLGIFVGLAGFLVFVFVYSNYQAGFLAGFSGLIATLCLHLNIINHLGLLQAWYTPTIMKRITVFAVTILIVILALMGWYLANIITKHEGFYPIETSDLPRAAMTFLNAKWAISLLCYSVSYRRKLNRAQFQYQTLAEADIEAPVA